MVRKFLIRGWIVLFGLLCWPGVAFPGTFYSEIVTTSNQDSVLDDYYSDTIRNWPVDAVVDSKNKIHAVSRDLRGRNLLYLTNTSGSWVASVIDVGASSLPYYAVAIDGNDKLHVVYWKSIDSTNELRYLTNTSGKWSQSLIKTAKNPNTLSLALDQGGKLHVAISSADGSEYAANASGSWMVTKIAALADPKVTSILYPVIAVDYASAIHFSFYNKDTKELTDLTNASGKWMAQVVDKVSLRDLDVVTDLTDATHLAYVDGDSNLKYASNATGKWSITTIENVGITAPAVQIAVSLNANVRIIYVSSSVVNGNSKSQLKYATNKSGSWKTAKIEDVRLSATAMIEGQFSSKGSIFADQNGQWHVLFEDGIRGQLIHASTVADWNTAGVGKFRTYSAGNTSLTVTGSGKIMIAEQPEYGASFNEASQKYGEGDGHIAPDIYTDGALTEDPKIKSKIGTKGSYYVNDSVWKDTLPDEWTKVGGFLSGCGSSFFPSLDDDSLERIHLSFYQSADEDLVYATNRLGFWEVDIIDDNGDVGRFNSMKVDSLDWNHVAYYDGTNAALKYGTNKSGTWKSETVDAKGSKTSTTGVGKYVALALDAKDTPHISYYDETDGALKYATKIGNSWKTSRVDTLGDVGRHTSIAVDDWGGVHISYYDATKAALKYATRTVCGSDQQLWNTCPSWSTENVDKSSSVGKYTSIDTDSLGAVHIAYYNESTQNLMYAYGTKGKWIIDAPDGANRKIGKYASLEVGPDDVVHISYLDETSLELRVTDISPNTYLAPTCDVNKGSKKTTLCHVPPGNPANEHKITVGESAVDAHLAHGDYLGECTGKRNKYYKDADGDGYGASDSVVTGLSKPNGYATDNTDCNDASTDVNPGKAEICDGIDNNCNGKVDENLTQKTYYQDFDQDGYGDTAKKVSSCLAKPSVGLTLTGSDCNDSNALVSPGKPEICDSIDNDCNGVVDDNLPLKTYYRDGDRDGYGKVMQTSCQNTPPSGTVTQSGDCNDSNTDVNPDKAEVCDGIDNNCNGSVDDGVPMKTYYQDIDKDGYGDTSRKTMSCSISPPSGTASSGGDCNDSDATVSPGKSEVCDGRDNNCNGSLDENLPIKTYYVDADRDGYGKMAFASCMATPPEGKVVQGGDCNDTNSSVNPGKAEVCDSIDNNCNAQVDENLPMKTYYKDLDKDGYGDAAQKITSCSGVIPEGTSLISGDCRDGNASMNPGKAEVCDGIDNNCSGQVDENLTQKTYYQDSDKDGYGDTSRKTMSCSISPPSGTASSGGDCNDASSNIYPKKPESCDGIDNDCNGLIDDGLTMKSYFKDEDGDGYGKTKQMSCQSAPSGGLVNQGGDCNDANKSVSPGQSEICDGVDNNCNGQPDDNPSKGTSYYKDSDGDGYGSSGVSIISCSSPSGYVANKTDCDDKSASVFPGKPEICDGVDNNCNGSTDEGVLKTYYSDKDGDSYGSSATKMACAESPTVAKRQGDCDDANLKINPSAVEIKNNKDDNCDGKVW